MKSTIHAPRADRRPTVFGELEHDGHRAQRLREAACPGRLLPDPPEPVGDRLVGEASRLAADAQLDHDEVRPVERRVLVRRSNETPGPAAAGEHPAGETRDDIEPLPVDVEQDELVDGEAAGRETNPSTSSGV